MSIKHITPKPSRLIVHLLIHESDSATYYAIYWTEARAIREIRKYIQKAIDAERLRNDLGPYAYQKLSYMESMIASDVPYKDIVFRWNEYHDGMENFTILAQDLVME